MKVKCVCGEDGNLQLDRGKYVRISHYSPEKWQKSKKGKGMISHYIGSLDLIHEKAGQESEPRRNALLRITDMISRPHELVATCTDVDLLIQILDELRKDKQSGNQYRREIERATARQRRYRRACPECGNLVAVYVVRIGKMRDTWLEKGSSHEINYMGVGDESANLQSQRRNMNCPCCGELIAVNVQYYGVIMYVELTAWKIH